MMKYVVDLDGHGRMFLEIIRSYSFGYREPYSPADLAERQKYLYNESASQIANIVSADNLQFLRQLQQLPNPTYFEHFDDFNDPLKAQVYINAFREFGFAIYNQIRLKLGLNPAFDYLLEAIAEDYMVICVVDKPQIPNQGTINVVPI